jgi:hypothetical protein
MFCQWFLQQCGTNPGFPAFVIFTDEAHFTGDGIQNFQNHQLWADENLHLVLPSHHQQRFSFNIWAGIRGGHLFGPHVFPDRLTGRNYKCFLENNMPDFLAGVEKFASCVMVLPSASISLPAGSRIESFLVGDLNPLDLYLK